MSPLALIFLIIGIPALIGLAYIFVRGSAGLRRYILTRIGLLIPMVFILASLVFRMRVLPGDRSALHSARRGAQSPWPACGSNSASTIP